MLCSPLSVTRRTVSRQRFGSLDTPLPLRLTLCWRLPSLLFVMNRLPLSCCISLAESSFGAAPCIPSPSSSCPYSSISSRTLRAATWSAFAGGWLSRRMGRIQPALSFQAYPCCFALTGRTRKSTAMRVVACSGMFSTGVLACGSCSLSPSAQVLHMRFCSPTTEAVVFGVLFLCRVSAVV